MGTDAGRARTGATTRQVQCKLVHTQSHFSVCVSLSPLSLPSGRVKSLTKRRRFPYSLSSSSPISHTIEEASSKFCQLFLASALEVEG